MWAFVCENQIALNVIQIERLVSYKMEKQTE